MSATQLHGLSTDVHGDIVASVIDGDGRPLFAVTVPVTDDRSAAEAEALARKVSVALDALTALARIRDARDATAEGHEIENGPALDQCFDDWAADVASAAIRLAQGDE